ncbi:MAG: hypothetical protein FWE06_06325 [Oscillospiraceae bacterium]|nr:hypothetical protein [Oscillospiraceae bacterium]
MKRTILAILLLTVLALAGCEDSIDSDLVGTWVAEISDTSMDEKLEIVYIFRADGSGEVGTRIDGAEISAISPDPFYWHVDGRQIVFAFPHGDDTSPPAEERHWFELREGELVLRDTREPDVEWFFERE